MAFTLLGHKWARKDKLLLLDYIFKRLITNNTNCSTIQIQMFSAKADKQSGTCNSVDDENECEKLLKPFDIEELRDTLYGITPHQLCKILKLPLSVPVSLEIFEWAGRQMGYSHSFDVYIC